MTQNIAFKTRIIQVSKMYLKKWSIWNVLYEGIILEQKKGQDLKDLALFYKCSTR